jgi:photosystem II stability/assembly factor-like uncharacterized protein
MCGGADRRRTSAMTRALVLSLLLLPSILFAGWSSSGPTGGAVRAVAVAPSDPSVIWAGNAAGVFRSIDGGATWTNVSGPVADVARIVVHPNNPDKAWVLSSSQGLWRTDDGGATWIVNGQFAGITPTALLLDPRNPDTLYVAGACYVGFEPVFLPGMGLYASTDGGATFKSVHFDPSPLNQCVMELAIDPFSPWRLFTLGPYSDIAGRLESYDRAQTWEKANGARPSLAVLFDPRFPFTHYGITSRFGDAFLVSQDGGFTWQTSTAKLPAAVRSLSIDPQRGRLFLGTSNGLFRSGDGGRVWAGTLLPDLVVPALDFGGAPPVIFAATNGGLFNVENRGLGAAHRVELHDIATQVLAMDLNPSNGDVIYASVTNRSEYGTATVQGTVFRSTNGGASWDALPNDIGDERPYIAVDAAGTAYAASLKSRALYRRALDDQQWTRVRDNLYVSMIAADPKTPGTVFIGGFVQRTRDGGKTWQSLNISGSSIAIDPSDPRWVYVGSEDHFYRSSDGGDTWTDLQPPGFGQGTRGIVVAPSNGNVIYRIGANGGSPRPERSDDRGASWHPARLPGGEFASSLAVDPHDENSVWATVSYTDYSPGGGLYHSTDGGTTWEDVASPFGTSVLATALRFDPSGRVLHVGFAAHGVWELTKE